MAYNLKLLRAATNNAIDAARTAVPAISGAINWGNLRCVSAEHWRNDEGAEGYRVWIEEAAPECSELHRGVAAHLAAAGFNDIEVITEW